MLTNKRARHSNYTVAKKKALIVFNVTVHTPTCTTHLLYIFSLNLLPDAVYTLNLVFDCSLCYNVTLASLKKYQKKLNIARMTINSFKRTRSMADHGTTAGEIK